MSNLIYRDPVEDFEKGFNRILSIEKKYEAMNMLSKRNEAQNNEYFGTGQKVKRGFYTALLAAALLLAGFTLKSAAQSGHKVDRTTNTPDQTLRSNATVNPSTLAMELSIPIADFPGRGGTSMPLVFNYTSKLWRFELLGNGDTGTTKFTTNVPRYAEKTASGWTSSFGAARIEAFEEIYDCAGNPLGEIGVSAPPPITPPEQPTGGVYLDCNNITQTYMKRVRVKLPDGSAHELRKDDVIHTYTNSYDRTGTFLSTDGSRLRLDLTATDGTLFLPDGAKYYFDAASGSIEYVGYRYEDRNGNRIDFDEQTRTWTDTLGRTLTSPIPLNLGNPEQTVGTQTFTVPGLSGLTEREYKLVWKELEDVLRTGDSIKYPGSRNCPYGASQSDGLFEDDVETRICRGGLFNPVVLAEIILPGASNSQPKYKFEYNNYGEITKIEYPTGASERFEYDDIPSLSYYSNVIQEQTNRGVVDRYVKESATATELHWTYEATKNTSAGYLLIKTTAPDQTTITERYVGTNWRPMPGMGSKTRYGFDNPEAGRPLEERLYSGTTLKSRRLTEYEWTGATGGASSPATRDARIKREISIIFEPNHTLALATMTVNTYDTSGSTDLQMFSALNLKSSSQYGYITIDASSSTSAAQTETASQVAERFDNLTPAVKTEIDYSYSTNYVNSSRSILGRVTEQRVINPANNNAVVSKTQMEYDQFSLIQSSSLPTAVAGTWVDPNTSYRGNVTTVRAYTDVANSQYVETESYYDQYGNVRKAVDGNDNESLMVYSTDYACAYPTQMTSPVPDSSGTNGSNSALTTSMTYNYYTGLPLTTTDANGQTTEMQYADALLRPTKVIAPNGHQTITQYGVADSTGQFAANQRFVKVKSQIDANNWKEGYSWFDGLGRTIKTQSVDSDGDVFTETEYDTMGRAWRTTNPFRSGETKRWTTNTFDAFGRVWKVTTPDEAFVETSHGLATTGNQIGTMVTVKDQALKERRSITNALGQLTRVDEPDINNNNSLGAINSPYQPTVYSYDILSNLVTVTQGSQTRSFEYDSLSRLKEASNPESGTINYSYDANGNLTSKTDARNITTTFVYDKLNRVKTRSYNDNLTPAVNYYYDNQTNAKGKLIKVVTGNTQSPSSKTEYTAFDTMGRVTESQQTTDGSAYGDPMTYTYNLSGALIEQKYPSGRKVQNVLNADGDLAIVKSKKTANHAYFNYANHFSYTAAGAVSSMQLGNGRWESTSFNSRLQPIQIAIGATQNATNLLKLDYTYNTTGNADNNGNVLSQTITVPTIGNNTGFTAVQTYTYDSLNRLKSATENLTPQGGSSLQSWKQTFTFDRYGNRNFDEANTTTLPKNCGTAPNYTVCAADQKIYNPQAGASNNKFSTSDGYTYDAAGNMTRDAQNRKFTYDGENKQTKVEAVDANGNVTGTVGEYFYDGDGKRVKKYVPSTGETTIFVYDASGKMVAEYSTQVAQASEAKVSYLTSDHLGSPRILTDANGNVISRRDFMPFGEEIYSAQRLSGLGYAADTLRQKFTSYERDDETDLDFAQARMFNYSHGRFTSPDPYKIVAEVQYEKDGEKAREKLNRYISQPQQWNRYVYAINNPLKYTDPSGEVIWFRGSREEQTAALQRVFNILGSERSKGIIAETITTKDGEKVLQLSMRDEDAKKIENIGDDADNKEFSKGMAEILTSTQVVEYKIANKYTDNTGTFDVNKDDAGGVTVPAALSKTGNIQIFVSPNATYSNTLMKSPGFRHLSSDGKPLTFTNEIKDGHEFGHARDFINGNPRGETHKSSVTFENAIRSRNPNNNQRRRSEL